MGQKFTNNASALITSNITPASLSFTIEAAFADRYPALVSGDWFVGTLQNQAGDIEIVRVNKRDVGSNAIQNIVRGQEGTTALSFSAGEAVFAVRATAAHHQALTDHVGGSAGAHAASAIGFSPTADIAATNAQAAIEEVRADAVAAVAAAAALLGSGKVSIADLVAQTHVALTTTGAAPAFLATPSPALTAYAAGQRYHVKPHAASIAGANTVNVSSLGAKAIKRYDLSGAKVDAQFAAGQLLDLAYDGVDFVALNIVFYEPPGDYRISASATPAPGTRRLLVQGQAVPLATYDTLAYLWCGAGKNATADFHYRCNDPLNPSTSRSNTGTHLVLMPPGYALRMLNTGGSGLNSGRDPYKLEAASGGTFTVNTGGRGYDGHPDPSENTFALDTISFNGVPGSGAVTITGGDPTGANAGVYLWVCF